VGADPTAHGTERGHHGAGLAETWRLDGQPTYLDAQTVEGRVRAAIDAGHQFLSFTSSVGRVLMPVTNGHRAKVVLLDGVGDAGQHAIDPTARGVSGGYLPGDSQVDEYPDRETIELGHAMAVVRDLVAGSDPTESPGVSRGASSSTKTGRAEGRRATASRRRQVLGMLGQVVLEGLRSPDVMRSGCWSDHHA
jgi:hypothetical protein